jgi:hypothetical protein
LRYALEAMTPKDWFSLERGGAPQRVRIGGVELKAGDRVRLRPRPGGDIFDIALDGKTATVESIEQDYENRIQVAVVLDDDPGRDLGALRQPAHRFFFSPEELEALTAKDAGREKQRGS